MAPPPSLPINRSSRLRKHRLESRPRHRPEAVPDTAPRPSQAVKSGRSLSFTGPPTMTITYSCIANGRAVLAELALTGGSYQVPLGPDLSPRQVPPLQEWRLPGPPLRTPRSWAAGSRPWGARGPAPREAGFCEPRSL